MAQDKGIVIIEMGSSGDNAGGVAVQRDGKIVVIGNTFVDSTSFDFGVARLEGDGQSFDICLQDDNGGSILQIDSTSGNYFFTSCEGLAINGVGTLTTRGCTVTLQHTAPDRRILATINTCTKMATASIQSLSRGARFMITDRNTANNSCACQ